MTSITEVLPIELTLNILLFCDSTTLTNVSLGNRIFYFLTCRDSFGDQILWRSLFLSELQQLQRNKDGGFKSTINKYLHKGKFPKLKSPLQFTDDQGNVIHLAKIYGELVDLSHIEVMGPGEKRKNIMQWKSAYVAHFRAKRLVQIRTDLLLLMSRSSLESMLKSREFWGYYEKFPEIVCEVVSRNNMLQLILQSDDASVPDLQWLESLFATFGVPDDILHHIHCSTTLYHFFKSKYPDQFVKLLRHKCNGALFLVESVNISTSFELFEEILTDYKNLFKQDVMEKESDLDEEAVLKKVNELLLDGTIWSGAKHSSYRPIAKLVSSYQFISELSVDKMHDLMRKLDYFYYNLGDDPAKPCKIYNSTTYPIAYASSIMGRVVAWFLDRGVSPIFGNRNILLEGIASEVSLLSIRQVYEKYPTLKELVNYHHPSVHWDQSILHLIARRYTLYPFEEWEFIVRDMHPDMCSLTSARGETPVGIILDLLLDDGYPRAAMAAVEYLKGLVNIFKHKAQHLFLKKDIDVLRAFMALSPLSDLSPIIQQLYELLQPYEIPEIGEEWQEQ